jgi:hypothetical protein
MALCRYLRWKSYHGAVWTTVEELALHHAEHRGPCTCLRTGQAWGPDTELASPECCTESRPCYVESPRLPKPGLLERLERWIESPFKREEHE